MGALPSHHYDIADDPWLEETAAALRPTSYVKNSHVEGFSSSGHKVKLIPVRETDGALDDTTVNTTDGMKSMGEMKDKIAEVLGVPHTLPSRQAHDPLFDG